jgi:hypothetical protein
LSSNVKHIVLAVFTIKKGLIIVNETVAWGCFNDMPNIKWPFINQITIAVKIESVKQLKVEGIYFI